MKKETKLYNVFFPIWILWIFPIIWLIVIPVNFIVDSLVLLISMSCLKILERKQFYKKHILPVFLFGLLADIIGSAFIFLLVFVFELGIVGDELYLTIPGVLVAGIMIFVFNYFVTFKKIDKQLRFKLSLIYAIVTAPYTFLIPTAWIY